MQDVFSKNPKMGDPASLASQLEENSQALDKLQQEIRKYEVQICFFNLLRRYKDVLGVDKLANERV
jgi:hypothetical protein